MKKNDAFSHQAVAAGKNLASFPFAEGLEQSLRYEAVKKSLYHHYLWSTIFNPRLKKSRNQLSGSIFEKRKRF